MTEELDMQIRYKRNRATDKINGCYETERDAGGDCCRLTRDTAPTLETDERAVSGPSVTSVSLGRRELLDRGRVQSGVSAAPARRAPLDAAGRPAAELDARLVEIERRREWVFSGRITASRRLTSADFAISFLDIGF